MELVGESTKLHDENRQGEALDFTLDASPNGKKFYVGGSLRLFLYLIN
jgi:hypothetical protein